MAVPNSFVNGTTADADEVNANFAYVGVVPIGTVLPWLKSYTSTPALDDHFVECNGQTLSDADSVYNGQVIPDLNGAVDTGLKGRFLRGHSSSGVEEDSANLSHTHTVTSHTGGSGVSPNYPIKPSEVSNTTFTTNSSGGTEARPYNYSVVFIMRVK